jgi:hypothetical protein
MRTRKLASAVACAIVAAVTLACEPSYFEIPIETPIRPKLDLSAFQRVLIAGFVSGGNEEVDANQETARLLRSQLRTKSSLKVIDADILPLTEIAQTQSKAGAGPAARDGAAGDTSGGPQPLPSPIKNERDIDQYERLFANTAYWKQLGEEYQNPLIVTGTVLFMERSSSSIVNRQVERLDAFGRRRVDQESGFAERKGFVLRPKLMFIDGRTGALIDTEISREEIMYSAQQNMPALSSYFELMDRVIPSFLSTLSSQKIRGTRTLLH